METCKICRGDASGFEEHRVIVCSVCKGKYGLKLRDKLVELDLISPTSDDWRDDSNSTIENQEIQIEGSMSFGNKRSAIEFISQLRDQFEISVEEVERFSH